jgi:hypothetical protein
MVLYSQVPLRSLVEGLRKGTENLSPDGEYEPKAIRSQPGR